jgi:hypothetical protein
METSIDAFAKTTAVNKTTSITFRHHFIVFFSILFTAVIVAVSTPLPDSDYAYISLR